MRMKFLSIIASFIFLSVAFSACMDSDETVVYSSDPSIYAFGLDTIHGKHYKFSIDQVERLIYNKDSLPMGADTILDRILIDTLSCTGWVTSGAPQDTLLSTTDSLDLRPAINAQGGNGIKLITHAADGTTANYTLQIRVHLQDPDSLTWSRLSDNDPLALTTPAESLQAILLGEELLLYTSAGELYRHDKGALSNGWSQASLSGLPATADLSTLRQFASTLYVATTDGELYRSTDGREWTIDAQLSGSIVTLVGTYPANEVTQKAETMVAVRTDEVGVNRFVTTTDGMQWLMGEVVDEQFPLKNLSFTAMTTANGVGKSVVAGQPVADASSLAPWFSLTADDWALMGNGGDSGCPAFEKPFITYYNNLFTCMGGALDAIYTSQTGIVWEATEKKFLLPTEMDGENPYTILSDPTVSDAEKRDYLWVITAKGTTCTVWRGRLNRLGFASNL